MIVLGSANATMPIVEALLVEMERLNWSIDSASVLDGVVLSDRVTSRA